MKMLKDQEVQVQQLFKKLLKIKKITEVKILLMKRVMDFINREKMMLGLTLLKEKAYLIIKKHSWIIIN